MGYGCTAKAGMVMDTFRGDGGSSNVWHYKGVEYFWEQGRENADGAITGSVWTTTGYCKGKLPDQCGGTHRAGVLRSSITVGRAGWTGPLLPGV